MLQKSLGYTINKFGRFYRVPEKNRHFQENWYLQNLSHELKQQLSYQNPFFWSKTLTIVAQIAKETGFLPYMYSLVKYITCLIDRG